MNDIRGAVGKKKQLQVAESNSTSHSAKSKRSGKLDALMANVDKAEDCEKDEEDDVPFVSTIVYSDDEEPKEETAIFAETTNKGLAEPEQNQNKDRPDSSTSERVDSAGRERRVTILPQKKPKKPDGVIVRHKMTLYTTLVFLDQAGIKKEIDLDRRPITYSELQREIAKQIPFRTKQPQPMYVVQNERGEKVFPDNYVPSAKLVVRELFYHPPPYGFLKSLGTRFESEGYHDARYKDSMTRVEDS
jgi:hypothetical protein